MWVKFLPLEIVQGLFTIVLSSVVGEMHVFDAWSMLEPSFIVASFIAANKNNWWQNLCFWTLIVFWGLQNICKMKGLTKFPNGLLCFYYLTDCGGNFPYILCFWAKWVSLLWLTCDFWPAVWAFEWLNLSSPRRFSGNCFYSFSHSLRSVWEMSGAESILQMTVQSFKGIMGIVAFLTLSGRYQRRE